MEIKLKRSGDTVILKDHLTQNAMEAAAEALRGFSARVTIEVSDDDVLRLLDVDEYDKYAKGDEKERAMVKSRVRRMLAEETMKEVEVTTADMNNINRAKMLAMVVGVYRKGEQVELHMPKEELNAYLGDLPPSDYQQIVKTLEDMEKEENERGNE